MSRFILTYGEADDVVYAKEITRLNPVSSKLLHNNTGSLAVGIIVSYNDFDMNNKKDFGVYETMASNKQVIKVLHHNTKGIFYNGAGGYWTRRDTTRTYLTADEEKELAEYIENFHKEMASQGVINE